MKKFFLNALNGLLSLLIEFVILSLCMSIAGIFFYFVIKEIPQINWKNFMAVVVFSVSIGFFLFRFVWKKFSGDDILG